MMTDALTALAADTKAEPADIEEATDLVVEARERLAALENAERP